MSDTSVLETSALETSALETSALETSALETSALDTSVLETLRSIGFLQGIADEHLERLAAISRPVEYAAHAEMFHESDTAKEVYVIVRGRVSLVICEPKVGCRQLMEVTDGEFIGWSPLVAHHRLSDTAKTLTPTSAIVMDGEKILALCKERPEFGFEFMHRVAQVLAERLSATRLRLLKTSGFQLPNAQIESD